MEKSYTRRHRLNLAQTLIICGTVYLLYRLFKSAELDREIGEFAAKHGIKG
jgi:hypothetical protein